MKTLFAVLFTLMLGCTIPAIAQGAGSAPAEGNVGKGASPAPQDYAALIQDMFAPVTSELKLTREQEFQIIAIITSTDVKSDPLVQKIDEVGEQLTDATLVDSPDEESINQLSAQEALLLSQVIALKTRAKASIYQVLTASQRSLVARQFRGKPQMDETLGAIGIY